ncbi:MAG: hypothetical protein HQK84_06075 [Nitrospinae bacterium]|nr:hypothetical protein [Nitrospinota bacterium]
MLHDKKTVGGNIKFALLKNVGEVFMESSVQYEIAQKAYEELLGRR